MRNVICSVLLVALFSGALSCSQPDTNGPDNGVDSVGGSQNDSLLYKFYQVAPKGTSSTLNAIAMVSKTRGYIAAYGTHWFSTVDGGVSWKFNHLNSTPTANYYCLAFTDSVNGMMGGGGSSSAASDLLMFQDDKVFWDHITDGEGANLRSLVFASRSVAIAIDDKGGIHFTTDGGKEWKNIRGLGAPLYGAAVQNGGKFWMVGWRGVVRYTADTGKTFRTVALPTTQNLYSVYFLPDGSTGWIVGDRTLLYTTDFGQTWIDIPIADDLRFVKANANKAYAVGLKGVLLMSSDVKTWRSIPTGTTEDLYGLDCPDSLWIVGRNGTLLTTMPPK